MAELSDSVNNKIKTDLINSGIFLENDTYQTFKKWGKDRVFELFREHPFDYGTLANPLDGTIDVLATTGIGRNPPPRVLVLPIECKKADASLKHWVFEPFYTERDSDKQFFLYRHNSKNYFTNSYSFPSLGYLAVSDYENCVNVFEFSELKGNINRNSEKEKRAFYAIRQANQAVSGLITEIPTISSHGPEHPHFFIPVVVTTANLWVANYDPAKINKERADIELSDLELIPKDWVIYSYPPTYHETIEGDSSKGHIKPEKRPTFIVKSTALKSFVEKLIIDIADYTYFVEKE